MSTQHLLQLQSSQGSSEVSAVVLLQRFYRKQVKVILALDDLHRDWLKAGRPPVNERLTQLRSFTVVPGETGFEKYVGQYELKDMTQLVAKMLQARRQGVMKLKFKFLDSIVEDNQLFKLLLNSKISIPKRRSILGKLFARYEGTCFDGEVSKVRFSILGRGRSRRYFLDPVTTE